MQCGHVASIILQNLSYCIIGSSDYMHGASIIICSKYFYIIFPSIITEHKFLFDPTPGKNVIKSYLNFSWICSRCLPYPSPSFLSQCCNCVLVHPMSIQTLLDLDMVTVNCIVFCGFMFIRIMCYNVKFSSFL